MKTDERKRIAVLVAVLMVVAVAGEVTGGALEAPVLQTATPVGSTAEGGSTLTAAFWVMQLVGILFFELSAMGRSR